MIIVDQVILEMGEVGSSVSVSEDGALARFTHLCKSVLSLDEYMFEQAMKLFKQSKHLLSANMSSIGTGTAEEIERYWFGFILYSVKRLSEKPQLEKDQTRITLCQILKAIKLNLIDFFKEMPQFVLKAGPVLSSIYGPDWEKRLEAKELQANFVHMSVLSQHYKRVYQEFFMMSDGDNEKETAFSTTASHVSDYHRFGWLLFLALRKHAFSRFKDIVTCTNGLVSILAILILHVPVRFRKFCIRDSPRFVRKGSKGVELLASLCNIYDTSEDDLQRTLEKANDVIMNILNKKPRLAAECKAESLDNIDTNELMYFEDLMVESSLSSSLMILEKDYDDAIQNKCELDERVFVNDDESLLGTGSSSEGGPSIGSAKRKFDALATHSSAESTKTPLSPPRSPAFSPAKSLRAGANVKMVATPVTTAMTTAKWLRTVVSPLPSKPSAELERYLLSCDKDLTNDVTHRAHVILEAIFPRNSLGERCMSGSLQSANLMDSIWTEQRRMEALKLYYRVLEAMCTAEAQVVHGNNLTSLLSNERFHRCMLACSAELVLATHKTVTMLFPVVLERTGITAFDLSKVIESFIRHEESLPRELRRHLNSLEERLLESMVWEKGSSMYNSLVVARPTLSAEINRLGLLAEPMTSLDEVAMHYNISLGSLPPLPSHHKLDAPGANSCPSQNGDMRSPKRTCSEYRSVLVERNSFTSPLKDRLLPFSSPKSKLPPAPLQSAFSSPTRPSPGGGGETCAETGINVFFTKILKLAAVRINGLVERLKLNQHVRETVYCFVQQILSQRTALFFNRHIDQIILCSLYGVAKISQLNLTFKEIVYNYRKQPQCKPQVFRSVFVDWSLTRHNGRTGQDHVDIITFYNEIFIPSVKPLLVELVPAGATQKSNMNPEVNKNIDGPCPGSPRVSSFPSLPDMSPKKVSAAHNVYVSPLRSSKMDALNSHSSKSYYACVGESTHAYQSPSKDLTAINNRLNGKKVNSRLNFDDVGLVSDSLVVEGLYIPNGSAVSSSGNPALNPPLKFEQPDS